MKMPVSMICIVCDVKCVFEFVCRQVQKEFDGGVLDLWPQRQGEMTGGGARSSRGRGDRKGSD